jgi:hypothetical protein
LAVFLRRVIKSAEVVVAETAEKVVAIVRGEPLSPQIRARLERAEARRQTLKVEVDALALDHELGDQTATERLHRAQENLTGAAAECERLRAALSDAEARDRRAAAEADVAKIEEQFVDYAAFADARLQAMQDFVAATAKVDEALGRLKAACGLMTTALPRTCGLPPGYIVGTPATVDEVAGENRYLLGHLQRQVAATRAFLLAAPAQQNEAA